MRIHIPAYGVMLRQARTGKGLFVHRLIRALNKRDDVEYVNQPEQAQLQLHLIKIRNLVPTKNVLRLATAWHGRSDYVKKNLPIRKSLARCDGVIYQSEYAKMICDHFLGPAKVSHAIIFNGADVEGYAQVKPHPREFETVFVASARWSKRPFKRLNDIIRSFLLADIDGAGLIVLGGRADCGMSAADKQFATDSKIVPRFGQMPADLLIPYLRSADAMVYLSPYEGCPNSVVEGLACRLPVLCTNIGATPELVRACGGYVVRLDKPHVTIKSNLRRPPPIDRRIAAEGFRQVLGKLVDPMPIDINHIAGLYVDFFRRILG